MKILLFFIGLFITLAPSVSASNYNNHISNPYYYYLIQDEFQNNTPEVKVELEIEVNSEDIFVEEYDEFYFINPTMTPYYYPNNNQKSHLPPNPYNYIY